MAKSKKKKQKNKDFQKVKLKVGKHKPRGLNETAATFKSRSINIKEQLKDNENNQTTTRRKLNIQETLSQCQHYSASIRNESLLGLKELINRDSTLVHSHLAQILDKVLSLVCDKDGIVRSSQCKLLRTLFALVPCGEITPFFNVLSAHLCCAMTHIYDDIQIDSLNVLDLCLEFYPSLVTNHCKQILPNFLEQISRRSQTSQGGSKARTLTVNPNSKLSSQKGRVQVLARLHNFFQALIRNIDKPGDKVLEQKAREYEWSAQKPLFIDISVSRHDAPAFKFGNYSTCLSSSYGALSTEELSSYSETLVPVLIECWAEACPAQLATDLPGNALSYESITILWNVLGILQLMLQLCNNDQQVVWFRAKYLTDFVQYFMPHFPYAMHMRATVKAKGEKKSKGSGVQNVSILTLNLELCKVMSYFIGTSAEQPKTKAQFHWQTKLYDFQFDLEKIDLDREQVHMAISIVKRLINIVDCEERRESLLHLIYSLYQKRLGSQASDIRVFLDFFGKVAFQDNKMSETISAWICSLPRAFSVMLNLSQHNKERNDIVRKLLSFMLSFGPRKHEKFRHNLRQLLFNTIFSDPDLKLLKQLSISEQSQLIQLLHWIPILDKTHLTVLAKLCNSSAIHLSVLKLLLEVVARKLDDALLEYKIIDIGSNTENFDFSAAALEKGLAHVCHQVLLDFLSFYMTVTLGPFCIANESKAPGRLKSSLVCKDVFRDEHCWSDNIHEQLRVTQECTEMLQLCCTSEPIESAVIGYVIKVWKCKESISLSCTLAMLFVLYSAIRRYNESFNCQSETANETSMDCSQDVNESSNSHFKTHPSIFTEFPEIESVLNDIIWTVASSMVAIETGNISFAADINMENNNRSENQTQCEITAVPNENTVQSDNCVKMTVTGDRNFSAFVKTGFDISAKCLNSVEALREKFMHYINRKFSVTNSDDVEIATKILSTLILPNCARTTEISSLKDFVSSVKSHLSISKQYWCDFEYKVSVLK